ncbi:hypothetical protein [Seonamhaeicola maritimus]|uniref:Uncharacterized protein n=1 Tax=Seonamhaeicola maritimus TaxID=2591822 RepID=A0A5C7GEG5_9FLAO|nr:hypothetical protein [Seonamhaeicola maritimus]TXG35272.1 hypothetical protein FUA22_16115 [Seonamhaeicola maritimus]
MNREDAYYFNELKKAIAASFLRHHSAPDSINKWKGEDIVLFQEDLFNKVKAKVSEKWFYTYFKNEAQKLPRIDMLNLLAQYVEFENWHAFKESISVTIEKRRFEKRYLFIGFPILVFALMYWGLDKENEFHFCFVDEVKNRSITEIVLDIKVLQNDESPLYFKTDSSGCFSYITKADFVKFVVQSPYHKTDTITRYIDSNINKTVKLFTDDYALMLHYYSNGKVKDWKKHKIQLEGLIANDAQIYQLFDSSVGVEVFTKEEFIRLLTIPTQNLKRIQVLHKTMKNEQIVKLKFIVK